MKSERRHELQANKLAEILEQNAEKVRPYSRALLGGLILVVAVIAVLLIWRSRERSARESAWGDFFAAVEFGEQDQLNEIAEEYPDSNAGLWARFMFADGQVTEGMAQLFRDHDLGRESLEGALDTWETLLGHLNASQQKDPLMAGRARLQMGRVEEALEDFDSAKEHYQFVVDTWPEDAVGKRAQEALSVLGNRDTAEFYSEFYKARPPAAPTTGEFGTSPAGQPELDVSEEPDIVPEGFDFEHLDLDDGLEEPLPGADIGTEQELPLEAGEQPLPGAVESGAETPPAEPATNAPSTSSESASDSLPLEAPSTDEPTAPATE